MQCGWKGSGRGRRGGRMDPGSGPVLMGALLVAVGMVMLFLFIPDWAWLALLGAVLIAAGCAVLRKTMGGR